MSSTIEDIGAITLIVITVFLLFLAATLGIGIALKLLAIL